MDTKKFFKFVAACLCIVCMALFLLIKSDYNYAEHKNAEALVYGERYFNVSDLSVETVEWLKWYNSLSSENQLAVSYEPYELRRDDDSSYTIDAKTADTR